MNKEVNDLKRYISLTGNKQFATFKIENVSNMVNYCEQLQQENKQLKDNWNELKEHCNTMLSIFEKMNEQTKQEQLDKYVIYDKFLSKMQELERSDSNVKD